MIGPMGVRVKECRNTVFLGRWLLVSQTRGERQVGIVPREGVWFTSTVYFCLVESGPDAKH